MRYKVPTKEEVYLSTLKDPEEQSRALSRIRVGRDRERIALRELKDNAAIKARGLTPFSRMSDSPTEVSFEDHSARYSNYGNSKYDFKGIDFGDIDHDSYRDAQQGAFVSLGNGLARFFTTGLTSLAQTMNSVANIPLATILGTFEGISKGDATKGFSKFANTLWDNALSQDINNVDHYFREHLKNYRSSEELSSDIFSFNRIFSEGTVEELGDLFGFVAGAAIGGSAFSKVLSSTPALANMAMADKVAASATLSALGEASIEALHGSKEFADTYINSTISEANQEIMKIKADDSLTNEYKQQRIAEIRERVANATGFISESISEVGNSIFGLNTAILSVSNAIAYAKPWMNGMMGDVQRMYQKEAAELLAKKNAGKITDKVYQELSDELAGRYSRGYFEAILENSRRKGVDFTTDKAGILTEAINTITRGDLIKETGLRMLSEGTEEMSQRIASEGSKDYYLQAMDFMNKYGYDQRADAFNIGLINTLISRGGKELQNPEAWWEFTLGAVAGGLGSPYIGRNANGKLQFWQGSFIQDIMDYKSQKQEAQKHVDLLNEYIKNNENSIEGKLRYLNTQYILEEKKKQALAENNLDAYAELEHTQLMLTTAAFARTGKLEDLVQMYTRMSNMSDEEAESIIESTSEETLNREEANGIFFNSNGEKRSVKEVRDHFREKGKNALAGIQEYKDAFELYRNKHGFEIEDTTISDLAVARTKILQWENELYKKFNETLDSTAPVDILDFMKNGLVRSDLMSDEEYERHKPSVKEVRKGMLNNLLFILDAEGKTKEYLGDDQIKAKDIDLITDQQWDKLLKAINDFKTPLLASSMNSVVESLSRIDILKRKREEERSPLKTLVNDIFNWVKGKEKEDVRSNIPFPSSYSLSTFLHNLALREYNVNSSGVSNKKNALLNSLEDAHKAMLDNRNTRQELEGKLQARADEGKNTTKIRKKLDDNEEKFNALGQEAERLLSELNAVQSSLDPILNKYNSTASTISKLSTSIVGAYNLLLKTTAQLLEYQTNNSNRAESYNKERLFNEATKRILQKFGKQITDAKGGVDPEKLKSILKDVSVQKAILDEVMALFKELVPDLSDNEISKLAKEWLDKLLKNIKPEVREQAKNELEEEGKDAITQAALNIISDYIGNILFNITPKSEELRNVLEGGFDQVIQATIELLSEEIKNSSLKEVVEKYFNPKSSSAISTSLISNLNQYFQDLISQDEIDKASKSLVDTLPTTYDKLRNLLGIHSPKDTPNIVNPSTDNTQDTSDRSSDGSNNPTNQNPDDSGNQQGDNTSEDRNEENDPLEEPTEDNTDNSTPKEDNTPDSIDGKDNPQSDTDDKSSEEEDREEGGGEGKGKREGEEGEGERNDEGNDNSNDEVSIPIVDDNDSEIDDDKDGKDTSNENKHNDPDPIEDNDNNTPPPSTPATQFESGIWEYSLNDAREGRFISFPDSEYIAKLKAGTEAERKLADSLEKAHSLLKDGFEGIETGKITAGTQVIFAKLKGDDNLIYVLAKTGSSYTPITILNPNKAKVNGTSEHNLYNNTHEHSSSIDIKGETFIPLEYNGIEGIFSSKIAGFKGSTLPLSRGEDAQHRNAKELNLNRDNIHRVEHSGDSLDIVDSEGNVVRSYSLDSKEASYLYPGYPVYFMRMPNGKEVIMPLSLKAYSTSDNNPIAQSLLKELKSLDSKTLDANEYARQVGNILSKYLRLPRSIELRSSKSSSSIIIEGKDISKATSEGVTGRTLIKEVIDYSKSNNTIVKDILRAIDKLGVKYKPFEGSHLDLFSDRPLVKGAEDIITSNLILGRTVNTTVVLDSVGEGGKVNESSIINANPSTRRKYTPKRVKANVNLTIVNTNSDKNDRSSAMLSVDYSNHTPILYINNKEIEDGSNTSNIFRDNLIDLIRVLYQIKDKGGVVSTNINGVSKYGNSFKYTKRGVEIIFKADITTDVIGLTVYNLPDFNTTGFNTPTVLHPNTSSDALTRAFQNLEDRLDRERNFTSEEDTYTHREGSITKRASIATTEHLINKHKEVLTNPKNEQQKKNYETLVDNYKNKSNNEEKKAVGNAIDKAVRRLLPEVLEEYLKSNPLSIDTNTIFEALKDRGIFTEYSDKMNHSLVSNIIKLLGDLYVTEGTRAITRELVLTDSAGKISGTPDIILYNPNTLKVYVIDLKTSINRTLSSNNTNIFSEANAIQVSLYGKMLADELKREGIAFEGFEDAVPGYIFRLNVEMPEGETSLDNAKVSPGFTSGFRSKIFSKVSTEIGYREDDVNAILSNTPKTLQATKDESSNENNKKVSDEVKEEVKNDNKIEEVDIDTDYNPYSNPSGVVDLGWDSSMFEGAVLGVEDNSLPSRNSPKENNSNNVTQTAANIEQEINC